MTFITDFEQSGLPPAGANISFGFSITYKVCTGKCLECKPGSYFNLTRNECKLCPPPTISTASGQLDCTTCPDGNEWANSQACASCLPGTFSTGGQKCQNCPSGKMAPSYAMGACVPCPENTHYAVNSTACLACPAGNRPTTVGNACEAIPIPPQPKNNQVVLIYLVVGLALLILGLVIFVIVKRKNSSEDDYEAVFTEEW